MLLTPVSIEPGTFMSTALLSELPRHVLFGISLNCLLFLHHFSLGHRSLGTNRAWPYKDLKSPKYHMPQ